MALNLRFEVCQITDFKMEGSTSVQCSPAEAKIVNRLQKD